MIHRFATTLLHQSGLDTKQLKMYSAHASEYEKYPGTPPPTIPPSAPHESQAIATGVPVNSSSGEYSTYSGNTRPAPPRVPLQILPKTRGPWSTGLCDCFSDPSNCKFSFFFLTSCYREMRRLLDDISIELC